MKAYEVTISVKFLYDHGEEYAGKVADSEAKAEELARIEFDEILAGPEMPEYTLEVEEIKSLPCHVCGTLISVEELDENGAYTYPENLPYCPDHQPEEPEANA